MTREPRTAKRSEPLDLDRGLPTTADDAAALRRLRERGSSLEQVMAAVRAAGPRSVEELRARGILVGRPFEL